MTDVTLSFTYQGPINMHLDNLLRAQGERLGYEWYGQGTDLTTGIRDIAFHAEIITAESSEEVERAIASLS